MKNYFVFRSNSKRRNQALEENELLRRTVLQREEVLSQCEHDMDKAKQVIDNTVQALSEVLQVRSIRMSLIF